MTDDQPPRDPRSVPPASADGPEPTPARDRIRAALHQARARVDVGVAVARSASAELGHAISKRAADAPEIFKIMGGRRLGAKPVNPVEAITDGAQTRESSAKAAINAQSRSAPPPTTRQRVPSANRFIRSIRSGLGLIIATVLFVGIALTLGIATAWFATHRGLPFNTAQNGPWVVWTYAGDASHEPYSRARFTALDTLMMDGDRVHRYEARVDNDGSRLHSSCVYEIESAPIRSQWWSLAAFDASGRLLSNSASRYGFNKGTIARDGRGHFKIMLARDAQPGNWLPTGGGGRIVVVLEAVETEGDDTAHTPVTLPPIQKVSC